MSLSFFTSPNKLPLHHGCRCSGFVLKVASISSYKQPHVSPSSPPDDVLKLVSADSLKYESGFLGAVPHRRSTSDSLASSAIENLASILTSRVYDVVVESPLQLAEQLSQKLGTYVWFKREDVQSGKFIARARRQDLVEPQVIDVVLIKTLALMWRLIE
uniref:Tryptophan synthase beta chain-like PALP domain-containing protein n=1 Tax=Chenopodium quinoa TaxID=63459 RepID=A0A803MZT6_CHEQI